MPNQKVLYIDDDEALRTVVSLQLRSLGIESVAVPTVQEGIEQLLEGDFALVLMDCMLPVIDGFDGAKMIREFKEFRELPILAYTASQFPSSHQLCLDSGMTSFLQKPCDVKTLAAAINKWTPGLVKKAP